MGWWPSVIWVHEEKNVYFTVEKKTWLQDSHTQKSATTLRCSASVSQFTPGSTTTPWHFCVSPSSSLAVEATETTLNKNISVKNFVFLKSKSLSSSPHPQWHQIPETLVFQEKANKRPGETEQWDKEWYLGWGQPVTGTNFNLSAI